MKIMKKMLTFILIFLFLESSSQKYNGVDLDSDLYSVINNLNKSGYAMLGSVINGAILKSTTGDNSQVFLFVITHNIETDCFTIFLKILKYYYKHSVNDE